MQLQLPPEQLLGVMDHMMCLEATWHNGGSLAKTLYSSLYLMQPERTAQNAVLSAYCRATEAMCAEVNHLIMTGCVCEVGLWDLLSLLGLGLGGFEDSAV